MKKMLFSLMLVFVMLFTMIPAWGLAGNIFIISKADIVGVVDGSEYETEYLPKGTVRAKMKFSNFTGEAQEVVLYITSKNDDENRLIAVNTKTVTVPDSATNITEFIDIEVKDNMKESVYLYVWDKHQSAYCEVEQWEKVPALDIIELKANVANNVYTYSRLWQKNDEPKVELDLLKVYNEDDRIKYEDDLYDSGGYLREGLVVYEGDCEEIRDYLGYDVDVTIFINSDGNFEVMSFEVDYNSVDVLTVTKDIVSADVKGDYVTFEYWEDIENDDRETEVDIASDAIVYVNMRYCGRITDDGEEAFESLAGSTATVKFVGAKGDDFTKVFITDKIYAQVEDIYVEDSYIATDKGVIELSEEVMGSNFFYTIYKNGEKIGLDDIKKGDVLSVVAPEYDWSYGDYLIIYVSDDTVKGTVTGAKADGITYEIDGTQYQTVEKELLSLGESGTFHLTDDGKIYSFKDGVSSSDNMEYGFIAKVGNTKSFGENTWQIRLLNDDNLLTNYTIASTLQVIKWDGYRNVTTTYKRQNGGQDTFMENLKYSVAMQDTYENASKGATNRLIRYELAENGEIDTIALASDDVYLSDLEKAYDMRSFAGTHRPAFNRLANYVYNDDTKFIYAPVSEYVDYDDVTRYFIEEEDITFITLDSFDTETEYEGYAYNIDSNRNMEVAVITSDVNNVVKVEPPQQPDLPMNQGYGLLIKVGSNVSFGEATWQMRMLTQNNVFVTLNVAPSLKVTKWNGTTNVETVYKRANAGQHYFMEELISYTEKLSSGEPKNCLIKYKQTGDSITEIVLVSENVQSSGWGTAYNVSSFTGGTYLPSASSFAGHFYNDSTMFFYVPVKGDNADIENASVIDRSMLDEDRLYSGYVYDKNVEKAIGATLITDDLGIERKEELSEEKYGFITKIGNRKSFGENTWQMRIFTEENYTSSYTVASVLNVTQAGRQVTYKRANGGQDNIMEMFASLTDMVATQAVATANVKQRMIKYRLNSSGEIATISIAEDSTDEYIFNVKSVCGGTLEPELNKFAGYTYNESSKLLYAPISATDGYDYDYGDYVTYYAIDEDDITFINASFLDKDKEDYEGYLYNIDSSGVFEMAVITSDAGFSGKHQPLAVVISQAEGLNAKGEKCGIITLMQSGETKQFAIDDDCTGANLSSIYAGDIIQYVLNTDSEIMNAEVIYTAENRLGHLSDYAHMTNQSDSSVKYVYGITCNVFSTGLEITDNFEEWNVCEPYFFNMQDNTTAVAVDVSKLATSPSTAITKLNNISAFKATNSTYSRKYVVVARVVDDDIVDAVSYLVPEHISPDEFNSHDGYVITY